MLKVQLFIAFAVLCVRSSTSQTVGTTICACQPSVYELTLDFGLVCADTTVGGQGIFDQDCLIATRLPDTINVTDLAPVTVSEIQILELDQFQDVVGIRIYNEGPYFNGDIVQYTSIVRATPEFINPVTLPRGFQVSIVGNNAEGQPIVNTWGILYDNDCGIFPLLTVGQTIGWTIFTDLGDPPLMVCPIAPPTDFPTASPVVSRTESPTVSPPTATTASPVVSPPTATTASPVVSRTESPVSPPSATTASPVVSRTDPPTEAATTNSPVESSTKSPTVSQTGAPAAGPDVSRTKSPTVSSTEAPTAGPGVSRTKSPTISSTTLPTFTGKRTGTSDVAEIAEDEEADNVSYDNGDLEGKRGGTSSGNTKKKSKQNSGKMSKISKSKSSKSSQGKGSKSGKGQSKSSGGKAGTNTSDEKAGEKEDTSHLSKGGSSTRRNRNLAQNNIPSTVAV